MSDRAPRLIIVAGANGSGKTTFAVPYTEQIGVQFLVVTDEHLYDLFLKLVPHE